MCLKPIRHCNVKNSLAPRQVILRVRKFTADYIVHHRRPGHGHKNPAEVRSGVIHSACQFLDPDIFGDSIINEIEDCLNDCIILHQKHSLQT